ncbi:MAG: GntR family transcriptional regulator [Casimicrobiaceae bacterium]
MTESSISSPPSSPREGGSRNLARETPVRERGTGAERDAAARDSIERGQVGHATQGTPTFQPLYSQIRALIVQLLETGEWRPGEAIPSEIDLAARFGVSQGTVRKAIDELADENILVRRQGKGTFVATHTETSSSMFRFLRIRRNDGQVEQPKSELLEVRRQRVTADIARLLRLPTGESVLLLRRVLLYSGVPTVYDEITLPAALFKGLTKERFDAYEGSMYGFFETEFGVRMLRAEEQIKAVAADAVAAEVLKVGLGSPLLCVERVAFTFGDRPVEFRRGLATTRSHHYANTLY